jgi:hypothetical protein
MGRPWGLQNHPQTTFPEQRGMSTWGGGRRRGSQTLNPKPANDLNKLGEYQYIKAYIASLLIICKIESLTDRVHTHITCALCFYQINIIINGHLQPILMKWGH